MNRIICAALLSMASIWTVTFSALPSSAQTQQLADACANKNNGFSVDQRIAACTGLIETGRVFGMGLAWALINRCSTYNENNESDLALTDCNLAIYLEPTTVNAFTVRGDVYFAKDNYDLAIADYSQALQSNPKDAVALSNRGRTYFVKGDSQRAIGDYTQAIQLDPNDPRLYLSRALSNFYVGAFPNALADLNRSSALDPKNAYIALWLDIVNKRSGLPSGLAAATTQIDMTKWPAPIIRLFLGKMDLEALLIGAEDANPLTKKGQLCEANFYKGELSLQRRKQDEATRLLRLAVADCPKSFIEYGAANAELKALPATPIR